MDIRNDEKIATIVDLCIEPILSGEETLDSILERYPDQEKDLRSSLEAALWLGNYRNSLSLSEEFILSSRRRVVNRIKAGPVNHTATSWSFKDFLSGLLFQRKFAFQLIFAIIFIFCLVLGNNSLVLAAQQTIPGDAIYPVKIAQERLWLFFSLTPENATRFQISFVEQRLQEIEGVLLDGRFELVSAAVGRYEGQYYQAIGSLSLIASRNRNIAFQLAQQLSAIISRETHVLVILAQAVPPQILDLLNEAVVFSNDGVLVLQALGNVMTGAPVVSPTPTPTQTAPPAATATPILPTLTSTPDLHLTQTEEAQLPSPTAGLLTPTPTRSVTPSASLAPEYTQTVLPTLESTKKPKATQPQDTPAPTEVIEPTNTPRPPTPTPKPPTPTPKPTEDSYPPP